MLVLHRGKDKNSTKYLISQNIKVNKDKVLLEIKGTWMEIIPETRSISFEGMVTKSGQQIFAALNKDGIGGDVVYKKGNENHGKSALYWDKEFCQVKTIEHIFNSYNGLVDFYKHNNCLEVHSIKE